MVMQLLAFCVSGLDPENEENPAFARCLTCSSYLCKECLAIHKRQRMSKGHVIVTLEEIKQAERKTGIKSLHKKQYCEEHEDEVVRLFCNPCKKAICRDCALVKHREHDYAFVRGLRPKVQELLENLMTGVQVKEKEFLDHKRYVDGLRKLNKSALALCAKEVEEMYKKMIAQLETQREILICEMQNKYESETKQIDTEENSLALALVRFENSIRFTRQLLDNGDDVEVMSMSVQTQETLENLGKMTWDRESVTPTLFRVKFDPEVTNVKPFGKALYNIHPEEILKLVTDFPTSGFIAEKVEFQVHLPSDISKRGYSVSKPIVTIENGELEAVEIKSTGVNCWTVSFTPTAIEPHNVTIVMANAKKSLTLSVSQPPVPGPEENEGEIEHSYEQVQPPKLKHRVDSTVNMVEPYAVTMWIKPKPTTVSEKPSASSIQHVDKLDSLDFESMKMKDESESDDSTDPFSNPVAASGFSRSVRDHIYNSKGKVIRKAVRKQRKAATQTARAKHSDPG